MKNIFHFGGSLESVWLELTQMNIWHFLKSSFDNGFNRLGYAIVIAGLSIAAALLMVADKPPKIFNIPAFGLFGIIISGVLGLAFIFSILRKK